MSWGRGVAVEAALAGDAVDGADAVAGGVVQDHVGVARGEQEPGRGEGIGPAAAAGVGLAGALAAGQVRPRRNRPRLGAEQDHAPRQRQRGRWP